MAISNIDTPLSNNAMGYWAQRVQSAVLRVGDGRGFVVDYQGPLGCESIVGDPDLGFIDKDYRL